MDRPHKKRSLTVYNKGRTASDKHGGSSRHLLPYTYLTDLISPLFKYEWKGHGHNNANTNTMTDFASIDESTVASRLVVAGDLCAVECVAGRQCYMEFNALPLYNAYDISRIKPGGLASTWLHPSTGSRSGHYHGYAFSLEQLMSRAAYYSRLGMGGNAANLLTTPELGGQYGTLDLAMAAFYNWDGRATVTAFIDSQPENIKRLFDQEFVYEGGYQEHTFTNTTTSPVFMEIREFMPREPLQYRREYGNFGIQVGLPAADVDGWAFAAPGLYETIPIDYQDQNKWTATFNGREGYQQQNITACDELDDKAFKYNKYMKITNKRFVVGEKTSKRIDPGMTFVYKMNLPPFKLKISEIFTYLHLVRKFKNLDNGGTFLVQGMSETDYSGLTPAFWPKFSKFVQMRIVGQNGGFVQKNVNVSSSTWNDKDSFFSRNNLVETALHNEDDSDPAPHAGQGESAAHGDRTLVATAPVAVLHSMKEKHACRVLPTCTPVHRVAFNYLPNAFSKTDIAMTDKYLSVDPVENNLEVNGVMN